MVVVTAADAGEKAQKALATLGLVVVVVVVLLMVLVVHEAGSRTFRRLAEGLATPARQCAAKSCEPEFLLRKVDQPKPSQLTQAENTCGETSRDSPNSGNPNTQKDSPRLEL